MCFVDCGRRHRCLQVARPHPPAARARRARAGRDDRRRQRIRHAARLRQPDGREGLRRSLLGSPTSRRWAISSSRATPISSSSRRPRRDLMARAAQGLCDDLATTLLLATDKRVLMAPAMNVRMWLASRDAAQCRDAEEATACCSSAPMTARWPAANMARAAWPSRWRSWPRSKRRCRATRAAVAGRVVGPLTGRHVLVTAGPTHEPIDPVRYIANRSSGKQGYAIAAALAAAGARVTLVSGPVDAADPPGVRRDACRDARARCLRPSSAPCPPIVASCAAAVADWRRRGRAAEDQERAGAARRRSRSSRIPTFWPASRAPRNAPALVVGFAAETAERDRPRAAKNCARKGCDWIVANDVSEGPASWAATRNEVASRHRARASKAGRAWPRRRSRRGSSRGIAEILATSEAAE